MIITRTPLRVSLFGGGTDLPSYYQANHYGQVLSFAINKHIYISSHPYIDQNMILLKYSIQELVSEVSEIKHQIFRELIQEFQLKGIDISVTSDIPAGSGLGSSSAFTVALYQNLLKYIGKELNPTEIAMRACTLEIEKIGEPIGKQDQYAAAFGGLNYIKFLDNEEVHVKPIEIKENFLSEFNNSLILVKVGSFRFAGQILAEQARNLKSDHKINYYHQMKQTVVAGIDAFQQEDLPKIGSILRESWELKRQLSDRVSTPETDELIERLISLGAYGAKLLGAGGGGYVLAIVNHAAKKKIVENYSNRIIQVRIEKEGSKVIYANE